MGFIRQFREERWLPQHLANRLPWKTLVEREPQAIIATKDDGLLCGYRMTPYDLAGRSEAERGSLMLRINDAWKRLERWGIWVKSTRVPWVPPPPDRYQDPFAAMLAQEHDDALQAKRLWTQVYAIYLWHRPPPVLRSLAKAAILGKGHAYLDTKESQLETFQDDCALWTGYLEGCCDLEAMASDELLTTLHAPLCLHPHPVKTPDWPLDIGRYLVDYGLYPKRFPPELGLEYDGERQYIRTLSLTPELPPETWVCMLEGLYSLPFPFELSSRWVTLPRGFANKKLNRMQRDIISAKKSFADIALEMRRQQVIDKKNRFADRQEDDIDEMRDLMLSDEFSMGDEVLSVVLKHEDLHELSRRVRGVMQVFQHAGCVVSDLDVSNTEGWIATQPGSVYADVRTLRWTSMNAAHVHPFYGPWQGETYVEALDGPPLFYAITEDSMPYGVSPYVGDLGLMMQIGPYGCHAAGTEILMANGSIKRVEEITVGDRVMGPDSRPRTVRRLHRGTDEMMQVVPKKGDPFTVNLGHILSLQRSHDSNGHRSSDIQDLTVREWSERSQHFHQVYGLYRVPVEFPLLPVPLPIHPYVLGVLLGDGVLVGGARVTNPDPEIREAVEALLVGTDLEVQPQHPNSTGCPVWSITSRARQAYTQVVMARSKHGLLFQKHCQSSSLVAAFRALAIEHLAAGEKYIPRMYTIASRHERLELLAGLIDTDGSLAHGCYDWISKSAQLAKGIVFIARSLGFAAYIKPCQKSCQGGFSGQYYRVSISGNTHQIPCRVKRKQAGPRQINKSVLLTGIRRVEPLGPGQYYGFECDSDHRYLTADFTVHHNSGKSTVNNAIAAAFRKEAYGGGADITIWDIDRSAQCTTYCYGGDWYNLGKGDAPIQVLAELDEPDELPHIYQWLVNRIKEQLATAQFGWDPDIGAVLMGVLTELQQSPRPRRMGELLFLLTQRMNKLGSPGARAMYGERASDLARLLPKVINALQPFAWGGVYGRLVDAPHDRLKFSAWTTFELRELLDLTEVYPAFLEIAFRRQRKRRHGQLCHEQYNEAWHIFSNPVFLKMLKEDIPSARKQRKSIIFSTQSLDQLKRTDQQQRNPLTELLLASCQVRWFGPNPQAFDREVQQLYLDVGLHEEELDRYIVRARPKREWYVVRPNDGGRPRKRLIDVRLGPMAAAVYGANSPQDLARMDELYAQYGKEDFGMRWLRFKGFDVEAPRVSADGLAAEVVA